MENKKFNEMILDLYNMANGYNIYEEFLGMELRYPPFIGSLFSAIIRLSFNDFDTVEKLEEFLDGGVTDMFMISSRYFSEEIQIYEWELDEYSIVDSLFSFKKKNGKEFKYSLLTR
jgi:hypothetical protein